MDTKIAPSPLFRDPVYDSPTDPVIIWNRQELCWWILYTQRRATDISIGYSSIHGTKIGVASSKDGSRWLYRGTLPGLDFEPGHNTFWAPEVLYAQGKYHMYVSYVTGIPTDWNYPRHIAHYTADNLWHWKFEAILKLSSERVIDPCVHEVSSGRYKMWYKDEDNNSFSYSAESVDLYNWCVLGPEITDCAHEGPNVFEFGGIKWMITDCWDGLAIYQSDDFANWHRCGPNLLKQPGRWTWDASKGNHADVLVANGRAYIFYFSRPDDNKTLGEEPDIAALYKRHRNAIQVAELQIKDGCLVCDRNKEVTLELIKAYRLPSFALCFR